jgi:ankyrin repeat protein
MHIHISIHTYIHTYTHTCVHLNATTYTRQPGVRAHGGYTALHCSAGNNKVEAIQELVRIKADIDIRESSNGASPLHWAARAGQVDAIKTLVELRASIDFCDKVRRWLAGSCRFVLCHRFVYVACASLCFRLPISSCTDCIYVCMYIHMRIHTHACKHT